MILPLTQNRHMLNARTNPGGNNSTRVSFHTLNGRWRDDLSFLVVRLFHALNGRWQDDLGFLAVRLLHTMNGFIIDAGGAYPELTEECKAIGDRIGEVKVDLGQTACKVSSIRAYIENMENRGRIGKKKAKAKC